VVLFLDASHFVHSVFLGSLWCFLRVFIKSSSGRKRWNVLGALDAVSLQVHTLCNDTYINSSVVCDFLKQLRDTYGTKPITIFLDNARYQRCALVTGFAATLDIKLEFLPSYSPNLNLIERVWKFVKKKSLYAKFYERFDDFKAGVNACLMDMRNGRHKEELKSLLSWKFQLFSNVNVLIG
jgi:transposase